MRVIADLHIHGRFSRGTSKDLTIQNLERFARLKGITLLGTGDFTHPEWMAELKSELSEDGTGILKTAGGFCFVLQTEISLIYTQSGKGRKVHVLLLAPSFAVCIQITEALMSRGRVDYDGRPIFKIPCPELVQMMRSISEDIEIIPAHIWTPWFSLFGSNSGFDSVEECFGDQAEHIHALETGLSSDPAMNWRLSALDRYALISNSDSHSYWPWRLGRECNIFSVKELTYRNLLDVLRRKTGFEKTIEFWPHEGKYHYDGHRNCNVVMAPAEATRNKNVCPVCGRPLTIGVLHRVEELADRAEGYKPHGAIPFENFIPLSELIAGVLGSTVTSQKVWKHYHAIVGRFSSEIDVLLNPDRKALEEVTTPEIAEIIMQNKEQTIRVKPGYDGVYGEPVFGVTKDMHDMPVEPQRDSSKVSPQKGLRDFF